MSALLTPAQIRRNEAVGLDPKLELQDVHFRWVDRKAADFDVTGAVTGITLDRTIEGASTLTIDLADPDGRLMSTTSKHMRKLEAKAHTVEVDEGWDRILAPNMVGRAMEVHLGAARFRLVKVTASLASNTVSLTFEDLIIYLLKRKRHPALSASRNKCTRAQFIMRLVREIKTVRVPFVCPDLTTRQRIDKPKKESEDESSESVKTLAKNTTARGNTTLDKRFPAHALGATAERFTPEQVMAAAYMGGFRGRELKAFEQIAHGESDYYPGVVQNDPGDGMIGHGLWQMTPNAWGAAALKKMRELGGVDEMRNPVKNAKMAYFLYEDAGKTFRPWYGTRYLTEAPGPGANASDDPPDGVENVEASASTGGEGKTTSKSYQFERLKDESSWTAITRLAGEVNRRAFTVGPAFYYMSEDQLFARRIRYTLTPDSPGVIDLTYDVDWGKPVAEASLSVTLDRWGAPPGAVVELAGFGPPDGRWLVTAVRRNWYSPVAELTLKQPGRQVAEPAAASNTSGGTAGTAGSTGEGKANGDKVDEAIAYARTFTGTYQLGGGHGAALSGLNAGMDLDCSSSTSLMLFKCGMWDSMSTARVSGMFNTWGKPGEGENMTVWYTGTHVFTEFKGKGDAKRFDTGGGAPRGPRIRNTVRTDMGGARHWEGT